MKSYIESLHAVGLAPFDTIDIKFSPDLNIIIGPNGAGKTSILKAIALCFGANGLGNIANKLTGEFWCKIIANENITIGASKVKLNNLDYRQGYLTDWQAPPQSEGYKGTHLNETISHNIYAIGASRTIEYKKIEGLRSETRGVERRKLYTNANIDFLDQSIRPDVKQWMINRYFILEKDWAKTEAENWKHIMDILPEMSPKNANIKFVKIGRDLEPIFSVNETSCYLEQLSSGFKSFL